MWQSWSSLIKIVTNQNGTDDEMKSRLHVGYACYHSAHITLLLSPLEHLNIKMYSIKFYLMFCMGVNLGFLERRTEIEVLKGVSSGVTTISRLQTLSPLYTETSTIPDSTRQCLSPMHSFAATSYWSRLGWTLRRSILWSTSQSGRWYQNCQVSERSLPPSFTWQPDGIHMTSTQHCTLSHIGLISTSLLRDTPSITNACYI